MWRRLLCIAKLGKTKVVFCIGWTLYFRDGASLLAVDIAGGDDLAPGVSRVVFADRFDRNARIADYDPMPSGEFVMLEPAERTEATAWVIVNWTALARAR